MKENINVNVILIYKNYFIMVEIRNILLRMIYSITHNPCSNLYFCFCVITLNTSKTIISQRH